MRGLMIIRLTVALICICGAVLAQDVVRIGTALSTANAQRIERYMAETVSGIFVEVRPVDESVITAHVDDMNVDILFGVDAQILERMAGNNDLVPYVSPNRKSAVVFYADSKQRYIVPFARPWCIAYATHAFTPANSPHELDSLLDPAFTDFVAVSSPAASPSLYVALIQRQLLEGHSEERAFGWLTSFDARIREYSDSSVDARSELLNGKSRLGLLPLDLLLDEEGIADRLAYNLPDRSVPITGLGLALTVGTARSPIAGGEKTASPAQTIYDHLLDPGLAKLLANEAYLLPCTRTDLDRELVPRALREASQNLLPYNPNASDMDAWEERWRDRVRGKGASAEQLDMALDLIFGLMFLVFIYFVFKHLNRSEI